MKKFKLEFSELKVESFDVESQGDRARGTVHGHDESVYCPSDPAYTCRETAYGMYTCDGYGSCDPAMLCQDTTPICL